MRVLFINHKDTVGGAAVAAYRLARGLEKYHRIEYLFLVAEKTSSDPRVVSVISSDSETIGRMKKFIVFLTDRIMNKLGLQYLYFPFTSGRILKTARAFKPDIISLQNTHGGYFKTSLIRKLSRLAPVVWTLHDMWSFTANAAHTFGDDSWKLMKSGAGEKNIYPHIGFNTGKWLLRHKKRVYDRSDLYLVAPSRWLHLMASKSPVFAGKIVERIYHGVDMEMFKPLDRRQCRRLLGIDENVPVLMFSCSEDLLRNPWKGGSLLLRILESIDSKITKPVEVIILGQGDLGNMTPFKYIKTGFMGYVSGDLFVRQLLCASDLFIYPSRADSLGLVLVESVACGTPCVSFDVGGCGEVVQEGISGFLVEPFDVQKFVDTTVKFMANREELSRLSQSGLKFARENFSHRSMVDQYHKIFDSIRRSRRRK